MGNDNEWMEGLEPGERIHIERLMENVEAYKDSLERTKKERDEYRDRRTDAARVFGAIAIVAATLMTVGAYLVVTTDATDHVNDECKDARTPQFSAVNGTGQHITINDICSDVSDSLATLLLGWGMFTAGMLLTTVAFLKAVSKLRD